MVFFTRKSKTGQQYSLILNRNQLDTSCAESDEDLTVEDYDIHDGDTNIVTNPDMICMRIIHQNDKCNSTHLRLDNPQVKFKRICLTKRFRAFSTIMIMQS